jgi:integrase
VHVVFNYVYKNRLIDRPMLYGEGFRRPSRKTVRKHRAEKGPQMFEAAEIHAMLKAAVQPLKAMVLLGVNCGYGNADVGTLPLSALNLDAGWIRYHRPKTGIDRRCPLWPETLDALREWLAIRPQPRQEQDAGLVFLTSAGLSWAKTTTATPLSKAMRRLLDGLGINGHRNFYGLRHTFQTVSDEARDFVATRHIMGHVGADIADTYRDRITDERLRDVVAHVHGWLFGKPATKRKPKTKPALRIVSA